MLQSEQTFGIGKIMRQAVQLFFRGGSLKEKLLVFVLTLQGVLNILVVTNIVTKVELMTRSISTSMAGVLERLELEQPTLVTTSQLESILKDEGIKTPSRIVASRLRDKGWLLPTDQRGVWEFAPAAVAGAFSSNDPLLPFKAFLAKNPDALYGLTFQSAAWAHEFAERVPSRLEVAASKNNSSYHSPSTLSSFSFTPVLPYEEIRDVPVLAKESIVVHMASKPTAVRSWQSALEWLPDLSSELNVEKLLVELKERPKATAIRTGYLLQGLRPDLSEVVYSEYPPSVKVRFGPREKSLRHDNHWQIADTLLPLNPKELQVTT